MSKRTLERRGRETRRALRRWTRRRLLKGNTRRRGWIFHSDSTNRRDAGLSVGHLNPRFPPVGAPSARQQRTQSPRGRARPRACAPERKRRAGISNTQRRRRSRCGRGRRPVMSCRDSGTLTRSWRGVTEPAPTCGPHAMRPLVTSEVRCDAAAVPHGRHWVGQRRSTARGPRPRRRVASAAHAPGRRP